MPCARGCCESFREHVLSVGVSALATPTRKPRVAEIEATEKRWHQDIPAYRRLRKAGIQPKSVDGAAATERQLGG